MFCSIVHFHLAPCVKSRRWCRRLANAIQYYFLWLRFGLGPKACALRIEFEVRISNCVKMARAERSVNGAIDATEFKFRAFRWWSASSRWCYIYETTVCAYVFVSSSVDIIFLLFFCSIHRFRLHAHTEHGERSEAKNAKTLSSSSSPLFSYLRSFYVRAIHCQGYGVWCANAAVKPWSQYGNFWHRSHNIFLLTLLVSCVESIYATIATAVSICPLPRNDAKNARFVLNLMRSDRIHTRMPRVAMHNNENGHEHRAASVCVWSVDAWMAAATADVQPKINWFKLLCVHTRNRLHTLLSRWATKHRTYTSVIHSIREHAK